MIIQTHWARVRAMNCLICEAPNPTLHHCHGGSMIDAFGGGLRGRQGGQKTSDWLVIPLAAKYHLGNFGIDNGIPVREWEAEFGTQVRFLIEVNDKCPYCIFDLAGLPKPVNMDK